MPTFPIVAKLPKNYQRLIGEIVTAWAIQEHELRLIVYRMLALDEKRGRLAVRSPRASEIIQMIEDLAHVDGYQIKVFDMKSFANVLDLIESRRNQLAHNIWLKGPKRTWILQELNGSWPRQADGIKVKKRVDPGGNDIKPSDLEHLLSRIRETTAHTRALHAQIAAHIQSSRQTHPAQSPGADGPGQKPTPRKPGLNHFR